jgi:periplasmic protein TonB
MAYFAQARRGLGRWLISACIVVLAHGGVAAAFVHWHTVDDVAEPTAALVVNLAPMPVSPTDTPLAPPGPEQVQAEATPQPAEKVEEKPEETREVSKVEQEQPDLLPAENPEVAMAALPPEARPEVPKTADNQIPAPVTTAPQAPQVEEAVVSAAPEQGQINVSNANAIPTWKRLVVGVLERHKRYPEAAQARNQHGTVELAFSLDRQGRVTASRIEKSSGSSALDEATLDLVRRAQPFPPPPPEMAGAEVNLSVPIRYNIR